MTVWVLSNLPHESGGVGVKAKLLIVTLTVADPLPLGSVYVNCTEKDE